MTEQLPTSGHVFYFFSKNGLITLGSNSYLGLYDRALQSSSFDTQNLSALISKLVWHREIFFQHVPNHNNGETIDQYSISPQHALQEDIDIFSCRSSFFLSKKTRDAIPFGKRWKRCLSASELSQLKGIEKTQKTIHDRYMTRFIINLLFLSCVKVLRKEL